MSARWFTVPIAAATVMLLTVAQAPPPAVQRSPGDAGVPVAATTSTRSPPPSPAADTASVTVTVPVRTGSHNDFGRIVFNAPPHTRYRLSREGDRVTVRFPSGLALRVETAAPRNVSGLRAGATLAEWTVAPGSTLREWRQGELIVVDVFDPPVSPAEQAENPAPSAPAQIEAGNASQTTPPTPTDAKPATPEADAAPDTRSSRQPGSAGQAVRPQTEPTTKGASNNNSAAGRVPGPSPPGGDLATDGTSTAGSAPPRKPLASEADPGPQPPPPGALAKASPTGDNSSPRKPASSGPDPPAAEAGATALPQRGLDATRRDGANRGLGQPSLGGGPVALIARRAPAHGSGPAIVMPFAPSVGAAVFQRGVASFVVFDEHRPVDLSGLRGDPIFGTATVQMLETATLLRLIPPVGTAIALSRDPRGWRIGIVAPPSPIRPIEVVASGGRITLVSEEAGRVVTMADPESGATLLIGTQRRPGQGMMPGRRTAELLLLPTGQGVAVEPLSDALSLRVTPGGFLLTGSANGIALSAPSTVPDVLLAAARLTRRFQFPAMPTPALLARVADQMQAAAAAAPLARGPKRRQIAETLIALGMAAEAHAILQVAAAQDPKEASAPDTLSLTAVAALVAGRPDEAGGLADPRLSGTDEIALWRAILLATRQEGSPEAATVFASTAPLLLLYPAALQDRLLPLALETMILGGQSEAAATLLDQRKDDPRLAFARALLAQAQGNTDDALRQLDQLAIGRDQLVRVRAATRAIEARLADNRIDAAQAADAIDKLLLAWRGDQRDLRQRLRLAELRQQAGAWRAAMTILREARSEFPAQSAMIQARLQDSFALLLQESVASAMPPFEFVALVEENADLVPGTADSDALRERLAERLLALDLPKRADQVLMRLMQAAPNDQARAGFGGKLAALRLRESDMTGALAALSASSASDLPPPLREQRGLTGAVANARLGDVKAALNALAGLASPAVDEARAAILEQAQDWPAAEQALAQLAAKTVPPTGELNDGQRRTLLRLATAAARAGNEATLASLRQREEGRIGTGPVADMFRVLTADPVRGSSDLRRSEREIGLMRAIPADLRTLQPAPPANP